MNGFLPLVEGEALAAVVWELLELLEPQALRAIEAATSTHDPIATRRARR
jgi:hypothetical protein